MGRTPPLPYGLNVSVTTDSKLDKKLNLTIINYLPKEGFTFKYHAYKTSYANIIFCSVLVSTTACRHRQEKYKTKNEHIISVMTVTEIAKMKK